MSVTQFGSEPITDKQKELVDEIIYLRGRIITSYSQVEFLLADIAVKLELKFPYLISARLKAAKRIAERPGYEIYKTELDAICDELINFDDIRNFMAHGWASLTTDRTGVHVFDLLLYRREGDGQFNLYRGRSTVERLRDAAEAIDGYTQKVLLLFRRIYAEQKLEG